MKKQWLTGLAVVSLVGCVVSSNHDAPTDSVDSVDASVPPSATPIAAHAMPSASSALAISAIDDMLLTGRVSDRTSLSHVGEENTADYRVRMGYRNLATPRPLTAGTPWQVATGAPVVASPATYSGWDIGRTTDVLAFAVNSVSATRGITDATQVNSGYVAAANGAAIFVLTNLYANAKPDLLGYALNGVSESFGLSGLLFNLNGTKLYALSSQGNLHCFTVAAGAMAECTGGSWPYVAGATNTVTWSSPYPVYAPAGTAITTIYFGDDKGHLHCVNGSGVSCWGAGNFATLVAPYDAKPVGPPVVSFDTGTNSQVIYVGDDKGRLFRIVDNTGATPVVGSKIASQDLCGGTPNTCNTVPWAIRGMPVIDFTHKRVYAAAGGSMFQFLLDGTLPWQQDANPKVFLAPASLASPIEGSPVLDYARGYGYVAFKNTLYKAKYPFDGTAAGNTYSVALQDPAAGTGSDDSYPLGWPLPYYGSIYLGTGTNAANSGIVEVYGCPAAAKAPVLEGVSKRAGAPPPYGQLIESGLILDYSNGNLNFGVSNGAASGSLVQYPAANPNPAASWGCPATLVSSPGAACGAAACVVGGCNVPADCALGANVATETCDTSGNPHVCRVATCNAGFADCDGTNANGCEVNKNTDVNNCGGCGTTCSTVNDTPSCTAGTCSASCNPGFSACGVAGNVGCPSTVACGASACCGATCGGGTSCNTGTGTCLAATQSVCATVSEHSTATVTCPSGTVVQAVSFVSYGTPNGACGAFTKGTCDANTTERPITSTACYGKASCSIFGDNSVFGDPCGGTFKRTYLQVECSCPTVLAQCANTYLDGAETDIDCGGGTCAGCGFNKNCLAGTDCLSGTCTAGKCVAGGDGTACGVNADCTNGDCAGGFCNAIAYSDVSQAGNQGWHGSLGLDFTVNAGKFATVRQMGAFDDSTTAGFSAPITVALYNTNTQAQIAGTQVVLPAGTGSPLVAGDRFATLGSPVVLGPGNYTIAAWGFSASDKNLNLTIGGAGSAFDTGGGAITFNNTARWNNDNPANTGFPATNSGSFPPGHVFSAGTFGFTPGTQAGTGSACTAPGQCTSGVCSGGTCQAPSCTDGVQNGTETDIDCGGATCDAVAGHKCVDTKVCAASNADCMSNICTANVCTAPACASASPKCVNTTRCGANSDCQSAVCNTASTTPSCAPPACANTCPFGNVCGAATDCVSGICTSGTCALSPAGGACGASTDCVAGDVCVSNVCKGGLGAACTGNSGCESNNCNGTTCIAPACANTCPAGNACDVSSECASKDCSTTFVCQNIAYADPVVAGNQGWTGSLGMDFTVAAGKTLKVTQVGVFDDSGNGISASGSLTVGIYSATSQTLIAGTQVTLTTGMGTLIGGDRMVTLGSPVTLSPGNYTIVAWGFSAADNNHNVPGTGATDTAGGAVSYTGGGRYNNPGVTGYPSQHLDGGPANRYGAGTFAFTAQ